MRDGINNNNAPLVFIWETSKIISYKTLSLSDLPQECFMLKALDWRQKTFPLSTRGKAVPGEKHFCRSLTSLWVFSGSLGVLYPTNINWPKSL